jgi:hypothetical protein
VAVRSVPRGKPTDVFLNCPFDRRFEKLYLAYIAGLSGLGLAPKAVVEISAGGVTRLERLFDLIGECGSSIHDLSWVALSGLPHRVPRFNMPFELGLAAATALATKTHRWFVFERKPYRLQVSLSDVNGVDPYIHEGTPVGILRELTNAFVHPSRDVLALRALDRVYADLVRVAAALLGEGSLFQSRAFRELVVAAQQLSARHGLFS